VTCQMMLLATMMLLAKAMEGVMGMEWTKE
jgi:hypothetical protein